MIYFKSYEKRRMSMSLRERERGGKHILTSNPRDLQVSFSVLAWWCSSSGADTELSKKYVGSLLGYRHSDSDAETEHSIWPQLSPHLDLQGGWKLSCVSFFLWPSNTSAPKDPLFAVLLQIWEKTPKKAFEIQTTTLFECISKASCEMNSVLLYFPRK